MTKTLNFIEVGSYLIGSISILVSIGVVERGGSRRRCGGGGRVVEGIEKYWVTLKRSSKPRLSTPGLSPHNQGNCDQAEGRDLREFLICILRGYTAHEFLTDQMTWNLTIPILYYLPGLDSLSCCVGVCEDEGGGGGGGGISSCDPDMFRLVGWRCITEFVCSSYSEVLKGDGFH
ncbi:hypothetical protein Tco_0479503 [Tanacetum coccineum]